MANTSLNSFTEIVEFITTYNPPNDTIEHLSRAANIDHLDTTNMTVELWEKIFLFSYDYLDRYALFKAYSVSDAIINTITLTSDRSLIAFRELLTEELTDEEQSAIFTYFTNVYTWYYPTITFNYNPKNTYFKNLCKMVDICI